MLELYFTCYLYCYSITIEPYVENYYSETYLTIGIESDTIGLYFEPNYYYDGYFEEIEYHITFSMDF